MKSSNLMSSNLFDSIFDDRFLEKQNIKSTLKTDIEENDSNYTLKIEIPGVTKDQINVDFQQNTLTVGVNNSAAGEEKDKKGDIIKKERTTGGKSRSFHFDKIKENEIEASFENGLLTLVLPKSEGNGKRTIEID